uniref:Uncharacterized protein n=1 Tax=Rhizophora mucronata TaxID=61149 RepID=A0A2P2R2Y3_RHIMU
MHGEEDCTEIIHWSDIAYSSTERHKNSNFIVYLKDINFTLS